MYNKKRRHQHTNDIYKRKSFINFVAVVFTCKSVPSHHLNNYTKVNDKSTGLCVCVCVNIPFVTRANLHTGAESLARNFCHDQQI